MVASLKWKVSYRWYCLWLWWYAFSRETFYRWLSHLLPRRLLYFVVIRCWVMASGLPQHRRKHPDQLTILNILDAIEGKTR